MINSRYTPLAENDNNQSKATLWGMESSQQINKVSNDSDPREISGTPVAHSTLKKLFELESNDAVNKVLWDPKLDFGKIVTINESSINIWSVGDQLASAQVSDSLPSNETLATGIWNSHNPEIIVAHGSCIRGWDLRSHKQTFTIEEAHSILVRALDYNSNKPYQIASGGDDCKVRFWDLRNPGNEIKEISGHSHWVWSVAYNRFHDQLFLSSGSDCQVNLQSIVSISSAAAFNINEEDEADSDNLENRKKPIDGLVRTYDQHEESVYAVAWSPSDAWIFCSLSFDGRAVVNRVPREEKYNILL